MRTSESEIIQPPDDLEERLVARLKDAGLIHHHDSTGEVSMKGIHLRWAIAATVLAALGVWAGTRVPDAGQGPGVAAVENDERPHFALMLYEDASYQSPAADQLDGRVAEYSAWARKLAGEGYLVDGAKLSDAGVLLHRDRARTNSVPTAGEGVLAGYFMIRAASLEEAERIAADCPHLIYGGTVSIRALDG